MSPKKNIVKSGNASSSREKKSNEPSSSGSNEPSQPPPLFPLGSKYPLSLLHERCQKLGWGKPTVDTRSYGPNKFSFIVTLSRWNSKTSEIETVRMEPHPPYFRPSAIEAKHWGATYALYRFCNGIQLNYVLPPGPRDYWNELAQERKTVPEHQNWQYEADPFEAKKMVEKRQSQATKKKEESDVPKTRESVHKSSGTVPSEYPEVIMATSLRELVEDAVKQAMTLNPEGQDNVPLTLSKEIVPDIAKQLGHLGFSKAQIQDAVKFLSVESTLASTLLSTQAPLQACIEYLILHVPECDLPERFLPSVNSSNPFITSAHSGENDLKQRWLEEKAFKEAGWPLQAVKECTSNSKFLERWDLLMVTLGRKLIGLPIDDWVVEDNQPLYDISDEEYEALGAHLEEPGHLVIPLFSAPIQIHILFSESEHFPRPGYIPVYITSLTAPAYIRLHLLSKLLLEIESKPDLEIGEGFCMVVMRIVEEAWADIEDNGPPEIGSVLKNLIPPLARFASTQDGTTELGAQGHRQKAKSRNNRQNSGKTSIQIKQGFEELTRGVKYQQILEKREKLPAFQAREEFLQKLQNNRVVIVVGETGCGKTTQLPQFILDSMIMSGRGSEASILITQPRRISAIGVSERVSDERINDGSVGYTIRGETRKGRDTKLLFCTTGVVLRRLATGDNLQDVSHIIVDEVHERSMDGDFLLLELKEIIKTHPTLKVILMSATINHETFVRYFDNAPLLIIPGFTHPVTDKYLEDVFSVIGYRPPAPKTYGKTKIGSDKRPLREEYKAEGYSDSVATAIQNSVRIDRIDYQLIASLVDHIIRSAESRGGILIFLPGVNEIRQCIDAIKQIIQDKTANVLPLHANLSNEEQRRVFQTMKSWKIIAATNVAETSITIDDVVYVIDAGKVKETQYDPETSLSILVETWVTRAAARQRRGRAGRTQPGTCYKLYTRKQEINMTKFPVPEILRVPLENISLSVKAAREQQDVKQFLRQTVDPPSIAALDSAWNTLEELNAVDDAGNLTAIGKYMAMLPVDVRLAKMLILGTIFQCLGPLTTVAALLSSKPLFNSPMEKREEANAARARFSVADSDILTDVNAYDQCMKLLSEGKGYSAVRTFCEDNFINANFLREITSLRQDFVSSLAEIGLVGLDATPSSPQLNSLANNTNLLKAAMLGGLWPRIVRVHLPEKNIKYDKVSAGTVRRENIATDYKMFDLKEGRVFLHPGSVLFGTSSWKPPFVFYFHKHMSSNTSKVFLRDATQVPIYAMLLFGGPVTANHLRGGLTIGTKDNFIKLNAIPRIGVLVNQLRRLLDAQLQKSIEDGEMLTIASGNPIVHAIVALLNYDGKTEQF